MKKDNAVISLVSCILRLVDKNVPILAIWQDGGKMKKIGSSNMVNWCEKLDDETKKQLESSIQEDSNDLIDDKEILCLNHENDSVKVRARTI